MLIGKHISVWRLDSSCFVSSPDLMFCMYSTVQHLSHSTGLTLWTWSTSLLLHVVYFNFTWCTIHFGTSWCICSQVSLWSDDFLDRQCSRQGRRCERLPPYQNIASHSLEYSLGHVESSDLVRKVSTHRFVVFSSACYVRIEF